MEPVGKRRLSPLHSDSRASKVFRLQSPAGRKLPVLVSVPHAGLDVPTDVRRELLVDEAVLRNDADLAVDELYADAPQSGATLLVALLSRYVVDLNRGVGDVDRWSVPDHPSPLADARRGVIWRLSTCGQPALARPLTLAALRDRIRRFHEPYHTALREELFALRAAHGHALLIDGHSMPAHGRGENGSAWRRRADIVPGCDGGASCAPELVSAACRFFRERGYSVAVDDPYRGGFITRNYGKPHEGIHALQIEVNRDLYLDPITLELKSRGFSRLRADLAAFVRSLSALRL
jgi:N-formylglutamate amidohydrolase